jgi:hypothetical protein
VSNTPRRQVARRYGLSETALRRHAGAHLPASLAQAAETGQAADSARLLERVRQIVADLEDMGASAKARSDSDGFLRTARELLRALELLGRVTGEIHSGTTVNVLVGVWQSLGVKDESEARALIESARRADVDAATLDEWCRQRMTERGWTCAPPVGRFGGELAAS